MMFSSITTPLILAILVPIASFIASAWVEKGKRRRAYKRITNDPLLYEGAKFVRLEVEGLHGPLLYEGVITLISVGRMEVVGMLNSGTRGRVSFTGREFEKLHPVMKVDHENGK